MFDTKVYFVFEKSFFIMTKIYRLYIFIAFGIIAKSKDFIDDTNVECGNSNNPIWSCIGDCSQGIISTLVSCVISSTCCQTGKSSWIVSFPIDITNYWNIEFSVDYYTRTSDENACYARYWDDINNLWVNVFMNHNSAGSKSFNSGAIEPLNDKNRTLFSFGGHENCDWYAIRIYGRLIIPNPTNSPTIITSIPSSNPTNYPSMEPTYIPTTYPSNIPTKMTIFPTQQPTNNPSIYPTNTPIHNPSESPKTSPTLNPTINLTINPTSVPTISPSITPANSPTNFPTNIPTTKPTIFPSFIPSVIPSFSPTTSTKISIQDGQPSGEKYETLIIFISIFAGALLLFGCIAFIICLAKRHKAIIEREFANISIQSPTTEPTFSDKGHHVSVTKDSRGV